MHLRYRIEKDCCIVSVASRGFTQKGDELKNYLNSMMERSVFTHLLLNLSGIDMLNSTEIGIVLLFQKKIQERQGQFGLCGLNQHLQEIFEGTRLNTMVHLYPSEEAAIAAFNSAAR